MFVFRIDIIKKKDHFKLKMDVLKSLNHWDLIFNNKQSFASILIAYSSRSSLSQSTIIIFQSQRASQTDFGPCLHRYFAYQEEWVKRTHQRFAWSQRMVKQNIVEHVLLCKILCSFFVICIYDCSCLTIKAEKYERLSPCEIWTPGPGTINLLGIKERQLCPQKDIFRASFLLNILRN